ncbi:MAG: hypothetical protein NVSMB57_10590 [Actinomycetota bacterium]
MLVRKLEHLTGTKGSPRLGFAVEVRDRKGPAHKTGAFEDDIVWIQLSGGLIVGKAKVKICWRGEFSRIDEIRRRTAGSPIHDVEDFWAGRPRVGYSAVAELKNENWIPPYWGGPRTYGYEWIVLDEEKKRASWLDKKDPPRGAGEDLTQEFQAWLAAH